MIKRLILNLIVSIDEMIITLMLLKYIIAIKDIESANIQDKYSFWNDISEDKLWQNRKEKMLQVKEEYSLRPHQTK